MIKTLSVELGERSYPIYIGEGLLQEAGTYFQQHQITKLSTHMIITDDQVVSLHADVLLQSLQAAGYKAVVFTVPSGEKSKSLDQLDDIIAFALSEGLDRSSTIIALGGGVVGDLAGFAAASFMRGVRFVQVPTTILAHDSSVGGKVAVNHRLAKNIIGAFHQPVMVLYDTSTLATLPMRQVKAGLSEVIKHGLIWDASFTAWCEAHSEELLQLDSASLQYALHEGCRIKSIVVSQDETEQGLRAILNLGHTIGHALEAVSGYNELLHGEAIAIGMVGAAMLAVQLGAPEQVYVDTKRVLTKFGLPTTMPVHLDSDAIMSAMMHDKKFKEGQLVFIVPQEIGRVHIRHDIEAASVRAIIEQLKQGGL